VSVIPSGFSQVLLGFTGSGVPHGAAVTFGVDNGGNPPLTVANFVDASTWLDEVLNNLTNDVAVTLIRVKNGPNDVGPSVDKVVNHVGGSSAAGFTPQVAILVRKKTAQGGHSNSGRLYLPGVQEAAYDEGGNILGSFQTGLQSTMDDGLEEFSTGGFPMQLLHSESAPSTTPDEIIALVVDGKAATQRRRLRG
jgi:hypothetical protein